jgi:GDP/UDP-N,N'-diacetylbacillosamine 2-epimerase (hydrolysing)
MKRKICVVTGTRAEYGLLYWLMKEIEANEDLELQLIVTGMHLSPEFGLTYKEIEKDFKINKKIEMLISSDTAIGISKSMGLAQIGFAEAYEELKPNFLIVNENSPEIFSAVSAATIVSIPVVNISIKNKTDNLINEQIKYSIVIMSNLHFTNTEKQKNRIIQLGKQPSRVYIINNENKNSKKAKLIINKIKNLKDSYE